MPHQPEGKLVKKLQDLIREHGGYSAKIVGGENIYQAIGLPDLFCGVYGLFVGVEVKLPGEKLRKMQVVTLHEIFNSGCVAAVVETVEQGRALLTYLKNWRVDEKSVYSLNHRGLLFDRGKLSNSWHSIS